MRVDTPNTFFTNGGTTRSTLPQDIAAELVAMEMSGRTRTIILNDGMLLFRLKERDFIDGAVDEGVRIASLLAPGGPRPGGRAPGIEWHPAPVLPASPAGPAAWEQPPTRAG